MNELIYDKHCPFNVGDEVPSRTMDSRGQLWVFAGSAYVEEIVMESGRTQEAVYTVRCKLYPVIR
jgi:hypothetical protein